MADRVAGFGGSWTFITIFLSSLLVSARSRRSCVWTILNTIPLWRVNGAFDPYAYILLNLVLSMAAAVQAPIILMSQNRQAVRDRVAAGLDYEIKLKAEIEIMPLNEKMDHVLIENLERIALTQQDHLQRLTELCGGQAAKP